MPIPPVQIERILFPTDFSPFSAQAFRHALALTRKFRARLKVIHVIPYAFPTGDALYSAAPWLLSPEVRQQAEEEMRQFLTPAREARIDHEVEMREGDSWREIVSAAEEMGADFVVLGTHGRTGLERFFLGSVTERLIPRLSCPVLTVGHEEGRSWETPGLVSRILCATDFSATSTEALNFSLALARETQAAVTLLNVIENDPEPGEPAYYTVPEMAPLREAHERGAREQLQQAVAAAGSETKVATRAVVGRAYKQILKVAAEERADLIVLGAQGHGPLEHLLFGSNALHVIRRASCPVLTVRPRGKPRSPVVRAGGLALASPEGDSREKAI
jgi:nucleotide-binding universal stress UspA family protein